MKDFYRDEKREKERGGERALLFSPRPREPFSLMDGRSSAAFRSRRSLEDRDHRHESPRHARALRETE